MQYYAICTKTNSVRAGFITYCEEARKASTENWISSMQGIVGFVGCKSLTEAIKRSRMMEDNKPNAWGVIHI